jgi:hypothetical protein
MNKHKRALAAAAAAAIATPLLAIPSLTAAQTPKAARGSTASTQLLRIFDHPVATTLTTANGKVINHPPYPQPQAGDTLDVYSLDYVGNHAHHAAQWTLSNHLRCSFRQGPPVCESNIAIGGSLLVFEGNTIVGGTGRYQGATGQVLSNKQIPGTANTSDLVVQVHEPDNL